MLNPAALLNAAARLPGGQVRTAIAYGPEPRQRLDVYAPRNAQGAPVVVFFYGGSWQRGSRGNYRFVAADLARRGLVVVVPDYRTFPDTAFPGFLEDAAAAVRWVHDHAGDLGGDRRKLVLMGHSAGAHIGAMLAFDPRWLGVRDLDPRRDLAGFAGLAGPYDFLPIKDPAIARIFADARPDLAATQPLTFVGGGEAPVFLGVAPADTIVRAGNSERLAHKLRGVGTPVTLTAYPRANHISLIGAFSPLLRFIGPVADDVATFVGSAARARSA